MNEEVENQSDLPRMSSMLEHTTKFAKGYRAGIQDDKLPSPDEASDGGALQGEGAGAPQPGGDKGGEDEEDPVAAAAAEAAAARAAAAEVVPTPRVYAVVGQDAEDAEDLVLTFIIPPGESLGLAVGETDEASYVSSVGARSPFRATVDGDPGLFAGDIIVSVNSGSRHNPLEGLRQARDAGGRTVLQVRPRPERIDAILQRGAPEQGGHGEKLGIKVESPVDQPTIIQVKEVVEEGALAAWNDEAAPLMVVAGDRIVGINNGGVMTADVIKRAIQLAWNNGQPVMLNVATYPPLGARQKPSFV